MNSVGIFWDYENCAPPTGTPGYVVAERLRATCGAHGSITQFRAYLELSTPYSAANASSSADPFSYPPTSPKTLALRSELQSSGVSLIDCPHNSRKNVADAMLACDLVCFALDHPVTPHTPFLNHIPSSPYSIPSTPFSYISAPPVAPPRTTIVLVSGDRDFAYPLAVLKARKYDVGLIVPPGGAHPALRAQANWVLNWKDVMEDAGGRTPKGESSNGTRTEGTRSEGQPPSLGMLMGASNQPTESRSSPRRSSFASRRGSTSVSRRGSVSASSSIVPPLPPPPPTELVTRVPASPSGSNLHTTGPASIGRRPPLPPAPEDLFSQLPLTPKASRRPSIRRAAKTGSWPPSRPRSRAGVRGIKADRLEQGAAGSSKVEQKRPQPTIIPVALTASPVGTAGPSFAAMSPQGHSRPHTPPLFSTRPLSPPPPVAPPALAPPPTPPVKSLTPPAKPPTPPRDAVCVHHRPSIPHVATPRPPLPASQDAAASGKETETSSQGAQASPPLTTPTLQSLVPAAAALRPTNTAPARPALTVPSLSIAATNTSTLTPATPVTPPASPPFRTWARLQPVYDGTDAENTSPERKVKRGKGKSKEEAGTTDKESGEHSKQEDGATHDVSSSRREHAKLAVEVGIPIKASSEPSAVSGVDSILRSYTERTPGVEQGERSDHFDQERSGTPVPQPEQQIEAPAPDEDEDEDEEKFDESFFASLARSPPVPNANWTPPLPSAKWTPPTAPAPRMPSTIKILPIDFASGESNSNGYISNDGQRSRFSTPRPVPRTSHSLPIGVPIMQSLLAGVEGTQPDFKRNSLDVHDELFGQANRNEDEESGNPLERVHSRTSSPPLFPPCLHRKISLPTDPTSVPVSNFQLPFGSSDDSIHREFHVLIDVLERWRRNGNMRPLRSLIGVELSRDVFVHAGVTTFREYVNRAVGAGVVDVGGGSVQGREWISLSKHWQRQLEVN